MEAISLLCLRSSPNPVLMCFYFSNFTMLLKFRISIKNILTSSLHDDVSLDHFVSSTRFAASIYLFLLCRCLFHHAFSLSTCSLYSLNCVSIVLTLSISPLCCVSTQQIFYRCLFQHAFNFLCLACFPCISSMYFPSPLLLCISPRF